MKAIVLCIFLGCSFTTMHTITQTPPNNTQANAAGVNDDFLESFDSIPDNGQPVNSRQLPWYLNAIQKPAAFVLIKACNTWDRTRELYQTTRTRIAAWWCTKKIRDKRTQTQPMD